VINNQEFSNQYYAELIGGTSKNDPISVLINDAPAWRRAIENGHRHWRGFPNGVKIVMVRDPHLRDRLMWPETNCHFYFSNTPQQFGRVFK
jgi:hypothetical protein